MFFVISGYLITTIVLEEIRNRDFSLLVFYERRVRRIVPALSVVILASFIVGAILLLPNDFERFGKSAVAAALSVSNFFFWRQDAGYFDAGAHLQPLMHTWSLGVEEQYYLLFPPALMLLARWRWNLKASLLLGWIASLVLSIVGVRIVDDASFFLLPARAWELLTGSLLAAGLVPRLSRTPAEVAGLVGAVLVLWSVLALSDAVPFPGEAALMPVLGSALIIHSGASHRGVITRLLSLPPLVWIGLISYSLYLWHWPVIVFWGYVMGPVDRPLVQVGLAALSVALAWASWRFVERPFRKRSFFDRSTVLAGGVGALAFCAIIGGGIWAGGGFPERVPEQMAAMLKLADEEKDEASSVVQKRNGDFKKPSKAPIVGAPNAEPTVLLWGDSHAGALAPALGAVGRQAGEAVRVNSMSGCPPLVGVHLSYPGATDCRRFNAAVFNYAIKAEALTTVVLEARWASGLFGKTAGSGTGNGVPGIAIEPNEILSLQDAKREFISLLTKTVAGLLAAGKRVIVVGPVPEAVASVPRLIATQFWHSGDELTYQFDIRPYRVRYVETEQSLAEALAGLDATLVDVRDALCDGTECSAYEHGELYYFDANHITSYTARERLAPLLAKYILPAPGAPAPQKIAAGSGEPNADRD